MSREWVSRLILAKAVLDELTDLHREDRKAAIETMVAGDRLRAAEGDIILSDPKGTHVIVDRAAFFAWVKTHAPHGLREVVDPAYEKAILVKGCDSNGEIPDGIELRVGQPVLSVRPTRDTREMVKGRLPELGTS